VATACSSPPEGRARWTLDLLAGAMVKLTEHDSISRETVRRRLAENNLKPWRKDMWCIPQVDGEYVARMEDVLDLYAEAPDPKRPVICFDESPTQLIGEVRPPILAEPGQLERYDCARLAVPAADFYFGNSVGGAGAASEQWGRLRQHPPIATAWTWRETVLSCRPTIRRSHGSPVFPRKQGDFQEKQGGD
jgi:hypothetical protein